MTSELLLVTHNFPSIIKYQLCTSITALTAAAATQKRKINLNQKSHWSNVKKDLP